MLKIGFILPSSDYLFDPFKGDPHTHFQILTVLEDYFNKEVNLTLIDLRGIKRDFAINHIFECDVFLYSVYTLDFNEQVSIVNNLRNHYPKSIHIAGGPHASVCQEECLKIFDSIILGDGEESIIQAIEDIKKLKLQKVYRMQNIIDINKYPIPSRKFLPKSVVARKKMMTLKNKKGFDELRGTTVIFSRGCTGRCAFCAMPQVRKYGTPGVRYRKPKYIEAEIEYLKQEYNMQGINLLDEIGIPPDDQMAIPHLEAIGRTGIKWRGQCRVDGITPEIAKLAWESGCVALGLGVESVSQLSLDILNKDISIERAKQTIFLLKQNGIEPRIYMILGLPGEPENIVEQTWSFIKETSPDLVVLSLFTVRPGTEIYINPQKYGIEHINTEWSNTMHMFGRYEEEKIPNISFKFDKNPPWGRAFTNDQIVDNYMELQSRLRDSGLSFL